MRVTVEAETEELSLEQTQALGTLLNAEASAVSDPTEDEDEQAPITSSLNDEEQAVIDVVREHPGHVRGFYHEQLVDDGRSPYEDPDDDDYNERQHLGDQMWNLQSRGFLQHNGNRWYIV